MSYIDKWRNRNDNTGIRSAKNLYKQQMCEDYISYLNNAPNSVEWNKWKNDKVNLGTIIDLNSENTYGDEKYLTTLPDVDLKEGDYIFIKDCPSCQKDTIWIVTLEEMLVVPSHKKFKITPCNQMIKIKSGTEIIEFPIRARYTSSKLGNYESDTKTKNSNLIEYEAPNLVFEVNRDIANKCLEENKRILISHLTGVKAFEILMIDCTMRDIVKVSAKECFITKEDDIENMIAFNKDKQEAEDVEIVIEGSPVLVKNGVYTCNQDCTFSLELGNEYASLQVIDENKCRVIGIKDKQYIVLKATVGNKSVTKNILIKEV